MLIALFNSSTENLYAVSNFCNEYPQPVIFIQFSTWDSMLNDKPVFFDVLGKNFIDP